MSSSSKQPPTRGKSRAATRPQPAQPGAQAASKPEGRNCVNCHRNASTATEIHAGGSSVVGCCDEQAAREACRGGLQGTRL